MASCNTMTWFTIPGHSRYELNSIGDVRTQDGKLLESHKSEDDGDYYRLQSDHGGYPMIYYRRDLLQDFSFLFPL